MYILDKSNFSVRKTFCVIETSFLVHNAYLSVLLAYGDANLGWASSPHRYGKYTENVRF